jgi:hypothetical protein
MAQTLRWRVFHMIKDLEREALALRDAIEEQQEYKSNSWP